MADSMRLDGQVAIVTGAAQGIGKGIALVLSGAGAKIVIGDIQDSSSTVKEIEGNGGRAVSMIMGVRDSLRIAWHIFVPSSPGSSKSRTIRSGRSSKAARKPSFPSWAMATR